MTLGGGPGMFTLGGGPGTFTLGGGPGMLLCFRLLESAVLTGEEEFGLELRCGAINLLKLLTLSWPRRPISRSEAVVPTASKRE